ncbi:hypothetical protein FRX31_015514, partial [Thalictrum thalictroides]
MYDDTAPILFGTYTTPNIPQTQLMTPKWGTKEELQDQMYDDTTPMFGNYPTLIISQSQPMTPNPGGQTTPAK